MPLCLQKLHGQGNDFLVLFDGHVEDERVVALCERRTGVGADGFIESTRTDRGVTFGLRNADGSPAEVSGNGLRCLGLACLRAGWWEGSSTLVIETTVGDRTVDAVGDGLFRVGMGAVLVLGDEPAGGTAVRVGNPHLVHLLEGGLAEIDVAAAPRDRNVEWVVPGPGADEVTMRVHERGSGETQACGSGSVAVASIVHAAGWTGRRVTVHNPGGAVVVDLVGDDAFLTGPAEHIADVVIDD